MANPIPTAENQSVLPTADGENLSITNGSSETQKSLSYTKELASGLAHIGYDDDGTPIGILYTPANFEAAKSALHLAEPEILSAEQFCERFCSGIPLSLASFAQSITPENIERLNHFVNTTFIPSNSRFEQGTPSPLSNLVEIPSLEKSLVADIPFTWKARAIELLNSKDEKVQDGFKKLKMTVGPLRAMAIIEFVENDKIGLVGDLFVRSFRELEDFHDKPNYLIECVDTLVKLSVIPDIYINDVNKLEDSVGVARLLGARLSNSLIQLAELSYESKIDPIFPDNESGELAKAICYFSVSVVLFMHKYSVSNGDSINLPSREDLSPGMYYDLLKFGREFPQLKEFFTISLEFLLSRLSQI